MICDCKCRSFESGEVINAKVDLCAFHGSAEDLLKVCKDLMALIKDRLEKERFDLEEAEILLKARDLIERIE